VRVWVTRTLPGAEATAARLKAAGHDPLVSPVLAVRELSAEIDLTGVAAIAFTSPNGCRAFAALAKGGRGLPVFAVGNMTAEAARTAGFDEVMSAKGDVGALAAMIESECDPVSGDVLVPCAKEPAADLAGLLNARGFRARRIVVYETVPAEPTEALAALSSLGAALVHSPKAARRLAELVAPSAAPKLLFACISEAAAAPLRHAGHEIVRSSPFPDEAGLLKLLEAE
jgi:uroporphyrinogen-III synthase